MQITVTINRCYECRHVNHSGMFTPGGAKIICNHDDIIEIIAKYKGIQCPPNYIAALNGRGTKEEQKAAENYIHWRHRVIKYPDKKIPAWCPLKMGCLY